MSNVLTETTLSMPVSVFLRVVKNLKEALEPQVQFSRDPLVTSTEAHNVKDALVLDSLDRLLGFVGDGLGNLPPWLQSILEEMDTP